MNIIPLQVVLIKKMKYRIKGDRKNIENRY